MTQSGTVGAVFLERLSGTGVSKFVSYGNRIDVDEGDLLAFFADDPSTKVIACYLEGLEDGRKFLSAATAAGAKKPVVVFKAARSRLAATASVSHTGFLGGSHQVLEGAFTTGRHHLGGQRRRTRCRRQDAGDAATGNGGDASV